MTRKGNLKSLACAVAVLCLGTLVVAQQVSVDFDRSADFSKFKTFAWTTGTPVRDDLNHQRIIRAIEEQLTIKGPAKVAADPDVMVAYHASSTAICKSPGSVPGCSTVPADPCRRAPRRSSLARWWSI